jgi:hypothetical protein
LNSRVIEPVEVILAIARELLDSMAGGTDWGRRLEVVDRGKDDRTSKLKGKVEMIPREEMTVRLRG